jgi:glutamyl-tRNA reductase
MKLACVGCNWKTPVALRERLAAEGPTLSAILEKAKSLGERWEVVLLSTCNRTELYVFAPPDSSEDFGVQRLCEFLAEERGVPFGEIRPHLYFHEGAGAALHLFQVAAGLDSLVVGEVQILGQTRDAYQSAVDVGLVGPTLHSLFQRAIAVAKRVQNETELSKGKLSIASAAVEFILGVFDEFRDKTVLVIGAGKMAELTLHRLVERRPKKLLIVNRTMERASELAARFNGELRPLDGLQQALIEADVVVSSTGADRPIVEAGSFEAVHRARRGRHLAIIDIAVPRDFDPAVGEFDNVFLWNIDHLERVRGKTLRQREKAFDQALKIIDAEVGAFEAATAVQQAGPMLARWDAQLTQVAERELEWLLPQLNGIPDADREKIKQFAHRLKNKFLHAPRTALRKETESGDHRSLIEALRKLFGL